ncbi:Uncharacterised protein [Vibrio cholerae]|nr:Uncharacterised protein [Vibrio cholerae]
MIGQRVKRNTAWADFMRLVIHHNRGIILLALYFTLKRSTLSEHNQWAKRLFISLSLNA